jgi:hypothetical protein
MESFRARIEVDAHRDRDGSARGVPEFFRLR